MLGVASPYFLLNPSRTVKAFRIPSSGASREFCPSPRNAFTRGRGTHSFGANTLGIGACYASAGAGNQVCRRLRAAVQEPLATSSAGPEPSRYAASAGGGNGYGSTKSKAPADEKTGGNAARRQKNWGGEESDEGGGGRRPGLGPRTTARWNHSDVTFSEFSLENSRFFDAELEGFSLVKQSLGDVSRGEKRQKRLSINASNLPSQTIVGPPGLALHRHQLRQISSFAYIELDDLNGHTF